jgi:hypothetical protein
LIYSLRVFLQPCGTWPTKKRELDALDYCDLIVTPLYAYRGLGMLSLQYLIFTILAIYAYLEWKNLTQRQSAIIKIAMFGPEVLGKQH